MASSRHCQVEVSWPVLESRSVDDIVIYNIESEGEDNQVPANGLDSLTDLFLTCPSEDPASAPPCTAVITFPRPTGRLAIAAVDVLSNARNVEVFSATEEYLVLAEGNKLDVAGDRKLFLSQHTFDEAQTSCSLKFVSLVEPSKLWLHSLHITLAACKTSPDFPMAMGPVINMDKVNAIMADMDATVPDRAKGLMSAMTAVQKNKEKTMGSLGSLLSGGGQGPPTMASIMGMFASMSMPSAAPPSTPEVPAKPQVSQDKTETDRNSAGKSKSRKNKSGKNKGNNKNNGDNEKEKDKDKPKDKMPTPRTEEKNKGKQSGNQTKKGKSEKDVKEQCETKSNGASGDSSKSQQQNTSVGSKGPKAEVALTTPVTQGDLLALEQRLQERIQLAEDTLLEQMTARVEASEQRIVQHMDNLLSKMASVFLGGSRMVNGASGPGDVSLD